LAVASASLLPLLFFALGLGALAERFAETETDFAIAVPLYHSRGFAGSYFESTPLVLISSVF
jgi:hypothetical protein